MELHTYFAPAERASNAELRRLITKLSQNPLMDSLLDAAGGLLAVLNAQRQILTVNRSLLDLFGIRDLERVLGLRPGEVLQCVHAHDEPGGCGTSLACMTCGAVIAMLSCLESGRAEQRTCQATVQRDGRPVDLYFQVRCSPFEFKGEHLLLLFLRDVTVEQQRTALERTFFHDINNLISALLGSAELLRLELEDGGSQSLAQRIVGVSEQLAREVKMQQALSATQPRAYHLDFQTVPLTCLVDELRADLAEHPAAKGQTIIWPEPEGLGAGKDLMTDPTLLLRVLGNMLLNALEASEPGQPVKFWIDSADGRVIFSVWNSRPIPPPVAARIFHRNFSTKAGAGRGLGTFSMQLFGETYLKGQLSFESGKKQGTVFRLALPRQPPADRSPAGTAPPLDEQAFSRG
jgi:signal transduction histidine kinase